MPSLTLIVAATLSNGIGQAGRLPWRLSNDMAYFARVTTAAPQGCMNAVIMGRNTWESIPKKFRPLKERVNVVVSSNSRCLEIEDDSTSTNVVQNDGVRAMVKPSLEEAISSVSSSSDLSTSLHRIFIIGGASLYKASLDLALPTSISSINSSSSNPIKADRILITRIFSPSFEDCDVFFPEFRELKGEDGICVWRRAEHEELEEWVGGEVPRGKQQEKGIEYEFQMWTRRE